LQFRAVFDGDVAISFNYGYGIHYSTTLQVYSKSEAASDTRCTVVNSGHSCNMHDSRKYWCRSSLQRRFFL